MGGTSSKVPYKTEAAIFIAAWDNLVDLGENHFADRSPSFAAAATENR